MQTSGVNIVDLSSRPVSPADFLAASGQLQFNQGDMRVCHTITINQDEICENNPNEDFFSNLALASGMQPITVIRERARIIIYDSMELECSKFYVDTSPH